jgi:hypothetical protein
MNISSIPLCAPTADAAFGPVVDAACRDGFDFTLVFEQSIFVLLPATMLFLMAPLRILQLRKSPIKVADHASRMIKLVSRLTTRKALMKASKQKLIASSPLFCSTVRHRLPCCSPASPHRTLGNSPWTCASQQRVRCCGKYLLHLQPHGLCPLVS